MNLLKYSAQSLTWRYVSFREKNSTWLQIQCHEIFGLQCFPTLNRKNPKISPLTPILLWDLTELKHTGRIWQWKKNSEKKNRWIINMILLVKNVGILTLKDIFIFNYPCQNIYFLFFILQYEYVWSPSYSGHNSKISSFVGKTFAYITSSTEYTVQYTVLWMLKNNVDIFIYCL